MLLQKRSGFTLIELMAALILSSLLLATVMGLAATLSQQNKALINRAERNDEWKLRLQELLQDDFQNCRSIVVKHQEVTMFGYYIPTLNSENSVGHVPMGIVYTLLSNDSGTWLVRTEARLDVAEPDNISRNLIAGEFIGFKTGDQLDTDVAPGVLSLTLMRPGESANLNFQLVRHGGTDQ